MTEEEGVTTYVVQDKDVDFLKDGVKLKSLLTALSKETKKAIEVLVALLSSKEEKTRLAAANRLLDLQVQVAHEISTDQMNRLIAQARLTQLPGQGKLVQVGKGDVPQPQRPLVDFGTVRSLG